MAHSGEEQNAESVARFASGQFFSRGTLWRRMGRWFIDISRQHPIWAIYVIIILFNVVHSGFNVGYNQILIHDRYMNEPQKAVFFPTLIAYNLVVYPLFLGAGLLVLRPLWRVHRRILAAEKVSEDELSRAQKLLVDLPFYQVFLNSLGWLPGAVIFPLAICWFGGLHNAWQLWGHFFCSFVVSALITIMQVFFVLEIFLIRILYPLYFRDSRPAEIHGVVPLISFRWRLLMLFAAVGVMPLVALLLVTLRFAHVEEMFFIGTVFFVGVLSAGVIAIAMGASLFQWIRQHQSATEQLARGNLQARVQVKRPDELGKLTDHFNDMAQALEEAERMRETFGQVVHPDVRDAIIQRYQGIDGEVCEITVLFADIRGFTRRSAGQPPELVFALLNRFLTLAVQAVENKGGIVDKFLGDGVMALFGSPFPLPRADHADVAVRAALEMLERLRTLNEELQQQQEAPLTVGIGIHTGPALVGCPGATLSAANDKPTMRRAFTAIGETVNLSQRMEQFTKTLGGPILISEQTRLRMRTMIPLRCLGEHEVPGYGGTLKVHMVT